MKKIIIIFSIMLTTMFVMVAQPDNDSVTVANETNVVATEVANPPPAEEGVFVDEVKPDGIIEVEEEFKENIIGGLYDLLKLLNYLFIIIFIISAWLINDTADAKNTFKWLNWWSKLPKIFRSLIIGAIWIVVFIWVFRYSAREEIFGLALSLLASMVIYKIGIDKFLRWLSVKSGMQFTSTKPKKTEK